MSKKFFYKIFKSAWEAAFTEENILNAFAKPGIWPINAEIVLSKIRKPAPAPKIPQKIKTPLASKAIRHFTLAFHNSPSQERADKGSKALQHLSAEVSILKHENCGLREALVLEQQKRKKGKRLNLAGEESQG